MTPNDVVEAMARAIWTTYSNSDVAKPELRGITWDDLVRWAKTSKRMAELVELGRQEARAAIRAVHERGGLVVARMPENATHGPALNQLMGDASAWVGGYNAALAAVRANAVEAEG